MSWVTKENLGLNEEDRKRFPDRLFASSSEVTDPGGPAPRRLPLVARSRRQGQKVSALPELASAADPGRRFFRAAHDAEKLVTRITPI